MSTIKDVAKEAGVGVGTVSRYINGNANLKLRNRMSIDNAIKKLGYKVNPIARSMKTQKTMTIAVVVHSLTNMFSMSVIETIEDTIEKSGYSLIVAGCHGNEENQYRKIADLRNKMVDGFIILLVGQNSSKIKKITEDIPVILVDRLLDRNIFDSVTVANEQMVYDELKAAIENGYKKIGIIEGPDSISNAVERKEGFYRALSEFDIKCVKAVKKDYTYKGGYEGMKELLESNLEAVFVSNREMVIGALNFLGKSDKDIYFIGFDDIELPEFINIKCKFISQPIYEIGKTAATLLLDRINNINKKVTNIIIR